jgi:hypothetical protein
MSDHELTFHLKTSGVKGDKLKTDLFLEQPQGVTLCPNIGMRAIQDEGPSTSFFFN